MLPYRPYQGDLVARIEDAWQHGARNVCAVLPTGAGKTIVFSGIMATAHAISTSHAQGAKVAIAHRQELVGQMSVALARCGVVHRIIAPNAVIKRIVKMHVADVGASFYDPAASIACAGVDTLIKRPGDLAAWAHNVGLWVIDEGHHVLRDNKWGKAVEMFPNARGLMVTATAKRADGKGLGRHAHGIADDLVIGPSLRDLINDGWLTDYRIFAPQSDVHLDNVSVSKATGDYNPKKLKAAIRQSHIVGDVIEHYRRIAPGRLGVTFASDVETATDIANQFNRAGVPAEVVSAKTPDNVRAEIIARFRRRELLQLVNVDLFGEGFDLPAIEVISMARPTESLALYCQQFGRALRLMLDTDPPETREDRLAAIAASSKPHAIIIDHVGNVERFKGPPDAVHNQQWTLDARDSQSRDPADDAIPVRSCMNEECGGVYERVLPVCPYCGHYPEPANRSAPEFVDGDLTELDPATLAHLRGEIEAVDKNPAEYRDELRGKGCPVVGQHAHVKRHMERQEIQDALRTAIAWWAGHHRAMGRSDAEIYRRFYHAFGTDVLSAQALDRGEAMGLAERVNASIAAF